MIGGLRDIRDKGASLLLPPSRDAGPPEIGPTAYCVHPALLGASDSTSELIIVSTSGCVRILLSQLAG